MRLWSVWLVAGLVGCSGTDGSLFKAGAQPDSDAGPATGGAKGVGGAAPVCSPGDTRECVGPGACRGAQSCDASGWGGCDCGSGGAGSGGITGVGGLGVRETGGSGAGGSASPDAGTTGTGGHVAGMPPCAADEKECYGTCQKLWPINGCGGGCGTTCPAVPVGGQPICAPDGTCSFECLAPYVLGSDATGSPTCLAPIQCNESCGGSPCPACPATSAAPCCCRSDTGGCGCSSHGACGG